MTTRACVGMDPDVAQELDKYLIDWRVCFIAIKELSNETLLVCRLKQSLLWWRERSLTSTVKREQYQVTRDGDPF
jgi:hypothetical protein